MVVNENNETMVKSNMNFHLRITFQEVNKKPSRSIIAIGDTVLINEKSDPVLLTGAIQRKYNEISYVLDVSSLAISLNICDSKKTRKSRSKKAGKGPLQVNRLTKKIKTKRGHRA